MQLTAQFPNIPELITGIRIIMDNHDSGQNGPPPSTCALPQHQRRWVLDNEQIAARDIVRVNHLASITELSGTLS